MDIEKTLYLLLEKLEGWLQAFVLILPNLLIAVLIIGMAQQPYIVTRSRFSFGSCRCDLRPIKRSTQCALRASSDFLGRLPATIAAP